MRSSSPKTSSCGRGDPSLRVAAAFAAAIRGDAFNPGLRLRRSPGLRLRGAPSRAVRRRGLCCARRLPYRSRSLRNERWLRHRAPGASRSLNGGEASVWSAAAEPPHSLMPGRQRLVAACVLGVASRVSQRAQARCTNVAPGSARGNARPPQTAAAEAAATKHKASRARPREHRKVRVVRHPSPERPHVDGEPRERLDQLLPRGIVQRLGLHPAKRARQ
jgi:hypothetical protein